VPPPVAVIVPTNTQPSMSIPIPAAVRLPLRVQQQDGRHTGALDRVERVEADSFVSR